MKTKMILCCAILELLVSYVASAQAYFEFRNLAPGAKVDAPVFDGASMPLEGTNYLAEIYGGPKPESLSPARGEVAGMRLVVPFRTGGYFTGSAVLIDAVPAGGWAWLQVRAWEERLGATYELVAGRGLGGYGESPLFYAQGSQAGHLDLPKPLIGLKSFKLRPTSTAVLIRGIRQQGNQVVVEWHPGFKRYQLQQTLALGQPWQNAGEPTTATSVTNSVAGSAQFFRVIGLLE